MYRATELLGAEGLQLVQCPPRAALLLVCGHSLLGTGQLEVASLGGITGLNICFLQLPTAKSWHRITTLRKTNIAILHPLALHALPSSECACSDWNGIKSTSKSLQGCPVGKAASKEVVQREAVLT